jgi:outer membrane lipoprotein-sorting protein
MKKYILLLTTLLLTVAMSAETANNVLSKAVSAVEKSNGIEATFSLNATKNGNSLGSSTGTIVLKGEKFRLQTSDATSWFDGKTQWSYQKKSDEVTVTTPTASELESINPYRLLSLYKSGYSSKLLSSVTTFKGRAVNAVQLTATDKKRNFTNIVIYIAKDTDLPLFIRVTLRDTTRNDITVTSCKTNTRPADSTFVFNKKSYPKAEVIDLR